MYPTTRLVRCVRELQRGAPCVWSMETDRNKGIPMTGKKSEREHERE